MATTWRPDKGGTRGLKDLETQGQKDFVTVKLTTWLIIELALGGFFVFGYVLFWRRRRRNKNHD